MHHARLNEFGTARTVPKSKPLWNDWVSESSFRSSSLTGTLWCHKGSGLQERDKIKGICFHCGIDGHWKGNCLDYLKSMKEAKVASSSGVFKSVQIMSIRYLICISYLRYFAGAKEQTKADWGMNLRQEFYYNCCIKSCWD